MPNCIQCFSIKEIKLIVIHTNHWKLSPNFHTLIIVYDVSEVSFCLFYSLSRAFITPRRNEYIRSIVTRHSQVSYFIRAKQFRLISIIIVARHSGLWVSAIGDYPRKDLSVAVSLSQRNLNEPTFPWRQHWLCYTFLHLRPYLYRYIRI